MKRIVGALVAGLGLAAVGAVIMERIRTTRGNLGTKIEKSVTVAEEPAILYRFWRDVRNLPHVMSHLESVQPITPTRSRWVVKGPAGKRIGWEAEIINDVPGRVIGWRTVDDAQVAHAGSVNFEAAPDGRSTVVRVSLQYDPPGGELGHSLAALVGADAGRQIAEDLATFKTAWERGSLQAASW
jgi:uncharacterized membrane protein